MIPDPSVYEFRPGRNWVSLYGFIGFFREICSCSRENCSCTSSRCDCFPVRCEKWISRTTIVEGHWSALGDSDDPLGDLYQRLDLKDVPDDRLLQSRRLVIDPLTFVRLFASRLIDFDAVHNASFADDHIVFPNVVLKFPGRTPVSVHIQVNQPNHPKVVFKNKRN